MASQSPSTRGSSVPSSRGAGGAGAGAPTSSIDRLIASFRPSNSRSSRRARARASRLAGGGAGAIAGAGALGAAPARSARRGALGAGALGAGRSARARARARARAGNRSPPRARPRSRRGPSRPRAAAPSARARDEGRLVRGRAPRRGRRRPRRQRRRVPVPARRRRRRAHLEVDEDLVAAPEAAPLRREVVVVLAIRNARDRDDAPARQALDGALVVVGAHLRAPVVRAGLAPLRVRAVPLLEAHEAAAAAAVVSPPAAGAVAAAVGAGAGLGHLAPCANSCTVALSAAVCGAFARLSLTRPLHGHARPRTRLFVRRHAYITEA